MAEAEAVVVMQALQVVLEEREVVARAQLMEMRQMQLQIQVVVEVELDLGPVQQLVALAAPAL